jgi:hypothetical protein
VTVLSMMSVMVVMSRRAEAQPPLEPFNVKGVAKHGEPPVHRFDAIAAPKP